MPNIFTLYSGVMISGIVLFLKLMTLRLNKVICGVPAYAQNILYFVHRINPFLIRQ